MDEAEDEERRLRVALVEADILNREDDTVLKIAYARWERWKALAAGLIAAWLVALAAWATWHFE